MAMMPREVCVDEFEDRKENIRMLAGGRPAAGLLRLRDPEVDDGRSKAQTRMEREAFERRVADAEDADDPLDEWLEYMQWADEASPTGGTMVEELVERITTKFIDDKRYSNNAKYLSLWLRRIDCVSDPSELFAFLDTRGTFEDQAAFYERYGEYFERMGRWREADAVFVKGIERRARPFARLQRTYRDFMVRMNDQPASALEATRPALAQQRGGAPAARVPNVTMRRTASTSNVPLDPVSVYEDDALPVLGAPALPTWQSSRAPRNVDDAHRKENEVQAGPWNSQPSAPTTARAHPVAPQTFDVFEDTMCNPLGGKKLPETLVARPAEEEKNIVRGYNISLVYTNGHEFSFEEMRAPRHYARIARQQQKKDENHRGLSTASTSLDAIEASMAQLSAAPSVKPVAAARTQVAHAALDSTQSVLGSIASKPPPPSPSCSTPSGRSFLRRTKSLPSPTINTRLALEEIDAMWKEPLPTSDDWRDDGLASSPSRSRNKAPPVNFSICEDSPAPAYGSRRAVPASPLPRAAQRSRAPPFAFDSLP